MQDLTPSFKLLTAEEEVVQPELVQETPSQVLGGDTNKPFNSKTGEWFEQIGGYTFNRSGVDTMTYAATIALDTQKSDLHKTTTVNATGNATINASSGGIAGQKLVVMIVNDATSGKTITFGTNFSPSGTLVGTASKTALVSFISDGSKFYETARTTGLS